MQLRPKDGPEPPPAGGGFLTGKEPFAGTGPLLTLGATIPLENGATMNRVKLLIVEDDQPFGWALKDVVARAGYRFRFARSGAEALEAVALESFDLVLQDIKLPDTNGLDVLQGITACQPRCGSIMMTGQGTVEDAIRAMKLGAFEFLTKPFRMEKLFLSIENFFESKGLVMTRCSLLSSCLFFKKGLPEMPCTTESLKDKYCRGNYGECARFIVCQACGNDKVPHNLSPNDVFETLNVT